MDERKKEGGGVESRRRKICQWWEVLSDGIFLVNCIENNCLGGESVLLRTLLVMPRMKGPICSLPGPFLRVVFAACSL